MRIRPPWPRRRSAVFPLRPTLACLALTAAANCGSATEPGRGGTTPPASVPRLVFANNPLDAAGVLPAGSPPANWDIYSSNVDGSDLRRLTTDAADDLWPSVSPDGTRIAFFSRREPAGIYLMPLDGGDARFLFPMSVGGWTGEHVTWSPDGRRLAFSTYGGVTVLNADGTNGQLYRVGFNPSWSPDGRSIAYDYENVIYRMDPDGTNIRPLVRGARSPAWSPDGNRLAFSHLETNGISLYAANADGTNAVALTTPPQFATDVSPSWSRNGSQLAFTRVDLGRSTIWVVNAAGLNAHAVPTGSTASSADPSWSNR